MEPAAPVARARATYEPEADPTVEAHTMNPMERARRSSVARSAAA